MTTQSVFISHASDDKPFVMALHKHLQGAGIPTWIDARELVGGNNLQPEIEKAIQNASAVLVVLSPKTINSKWVTKETQYALKLQKERGDDLRVIPLLLPGITFDGMDHWFPDGPLGISLEMEPGELDAAMPHILSALGVQLPTYAPKPEPTPPAPTAELILELRNPKMRLADGTRRAVAEAALTYRPPNNTARDVESKRYSFNAPLGPIEAGDLTWYLETYWRWRTPVSRDRAAHIEAQLPQWGKLLYDEVRKTVSQGAFAAWEAADKGTARCFTVLVDHELIEGSPDAEQAEADEAAVLLLRLPWELLHEGDGYLFQGAQGIRVRRQLPNRKRQDNYDTDAPIRVLLVSPRPEDTRAGYIDHRVSARPLVEALAPLGSLAELKLLSPPTFPAFVDELHRAEKAGKPYHVVHFDGHGVYDPVKGLGALVFEDPSDSGKLNERGSQIVHAEDIAANVRKHRVPLVFSMRVRRR